MVKSPIFVGESTPRWPRQWNSRENLSQSIYLFGWLCFIAGFAGCVFKVLFSPPKKDVPYEKTLFKQILILYNNIMGPLSFNIIPLHSLSKTILFLVRIRHLHSKRSPFWMRVHPSWFLGFCHMTREGIDNGGLYYRMYIIYYTMWGPQDS